MHREFVRKQEVFSDENGQFIFIKKINTTNPSMSMVFDNAY